jgi:hypothetical protein
MRMKHLLTTLVFTAALLLTSGVFAQTQRGQELEAAPVGPSVSCEGPCESNGQTGTKEMHYGTCFCVMSQTSSFESAPEPTSVAPTEDEREEAAANRCTQEGCNNACAPNTCAGFRATATGCRYSCLLDTVEERRPR